jgi:uncharacterized membrane protein YidH (DUF202 family)
VIDEPWDSGLQNERTRLAWQRTSLSGLVCSLLVARLLAPISLPLAVLVGLAAVLSTAALSWFSINRYAGVHDALHRNRPIGDGRSHLAVTALVLITAVGSIAYVAIV